MAHPPRIPVRLPEDRPVIYFLTFCITPRRPVLTQKGFFDTLILSLAKLDQWSTLLGVVMPDHIHLLAAPCHRAASVGSFSGLLKKATHHALPQEAQWQPGCFDRLLRHDESAESKWHYIRENPVRAGLVGHWKDWPWRIDPTLPL
jgi:putative transposase